MLLTDDLLLNYKRCQRRAFLNVYGNIQEKDPDKDFLLKLRRESDKQVQQALADKVYQQPQTSTHTWRSLARETESLMAQGVECIYQGLLTTEDSSNLMMPVRDITEHQVVFLGHPTLLVKKPGNSRFGDWLYIPVNVKLGRRPKPEYKLIAAFHAQLLANIQGCLPPVSKLILRQQNDYDVPLAPWLMRLRELVTECFDILSQQQEPEVFISRQRCSLCNWYGHCYAIAQKQQHLSLVPGVTPKRYASLQSMGVETLASLAAACPIGMGELIGVDIATSLKQQAQSIIDNEAMLKVNSYYLPQKSLLTARYHLYFDIEAEPELNLDYLLGIVVVDRQENKKEFFGFLAEDKEQEGQIWSQFLHLVNLYPDAPIFHFSEYEAETAKRLAHLYRTPLSQKQSLIARFVDVHHWVTQSVILPVESYSLKSLGNWLGFQWRIPEGMGSIRTLGGDQCVYWYDQWLITRDRAFLEAIIHYNEDDCLATYHLQSWLLQFLLNSDLQ